VQLTPASHAPFFLRDVNFFPFDFFDQPSFFCKRIEQTVSFLSDLAMGAAHCVYAACAINELEGSTTTALKLRKIYRKKQNHHRITEEKTKYIHVFPLAKKWLLLGEVDVEVESELELELEELQQAR